MRSRIAQPVLAIALLGLLAACDRGDSPDAVDTGSDSRASSAGQGLGQRIGEGYVEQLREAEAARAAAENRARELEALNARLRD